MISAWTIVAVPSEVYSFGWLCAIPYPFTALLLMISANYLFLPVYHQSGIDNCYMVSRMSTSRTFYSNFNPRNITVFGAEIQSNNAMHFNCRMDAARDVLHANRSILAISGIRRRFELVILRDIHLKLIYFPLFLSVTGHNVHAVNIIACYCCVIYTMLVSVWACTHRDDMK